MNRLLPFSQPIVIDPDIGIIDAGGGVEGNSALEMIDGLGITPLLEHADADQVVDIRPFLILGQALAQDPDRLFVFAQVLQQLPL